MKKIIIFIIYICINIATLCAYSSMDIGGMSANQVENYLLGIEGLEIIERTDKLSQVEWYEYWYSHYEKGGKNPYYDELNRDPKIKAIIDSVDFEIETLIRIDDLLYIFPYGSDKLVEVFSISTGKLAMQKLIYGATLVLYWKKAGVFVYRGLEKENGEYKYYLYLYDVDTLELHQKVELLRANITPSSFQHGDAIEYSDTQLIVVYGKIHNSSLMLYDVFTQEAQYLLDLRPIFENSYDELWNLHWVDENTIGFTVSKRSEYFICQYDLTKMVLKDIDENTLP